MSKGEEEDGDNPQKTSWQTLPLSALARGPLASWKATGRSPAKASRSGQVREPVQTNELANSAAIDVTTMSNTGAKAALKMQRTT